MMALALLGALVIGLSLGLLGSGGSILTVPVLVFILQRPEKLAIAESLAIVGSIALLGALPHAIRHSVHWKSVFYFGLPGMLGAYIGACCSSYISGSFQLTFFACIMLLVSFLMFFDPIKFRTFDDIRYSNQAMMLEGILVGCLTGFIGIGGGFLILPALVLLRQLSMSLAIGTSLVIIFLNAIAGFVKQFFLLQELNLHVSWQIVLMMTSAGILGNFTGSFIAKKISQTRLKQIFGVSIFCMGSYILLHHYGLGGMEDHLQLVKNR